MERGWTCICISVVLCALALSAASACGSHVMVFVSDRDEPGNYDIYALNPTTNEIRRLTTHPAVDNHATVSPDGTKIAWSSNRREVKEGAPLSNADGDFEIFVADWSDTDYIDGPTDGVTDRLPTPESGTLYWKVVANDPHGGMRDGPVWSFSVDPLEPPSTVTKVHNISAKFVIEHSDGVVTTYPLDGVVVLKRPDEVPPGDPIPIEIVALDLVSVEPIRVRLNSAIPSTGQTTITELPGGNWHIPSFFDIHTEIHLHDDGLLINPGPLRLEGSGEGEEPQSLPGEMEMPVGAPPVPICPGEDPGCELPRIIDVEWYEEGEGHPTHVSGTANAPLNGSAIVGPMPGSNELLLGDVFPSSPFGPEEFWSYACQQDRSAGIRIDLPNYSESLGGSGTIWRRVMVVGRTVLKDSELRIEAIYVEDMGPAEELRPLFVPIPRLGGAKFGHQPAVGSGAGLTNVGLLVKTSGRVTEVVPGSVEDHPYFYLEDSGSAVKVIVYSDAELLLSEGDFVDVTGFLGAEAAPTPDCADCGAPVIHLRDQHYGKYTCATGVVLETFVAPDLSYSGYTLVDSESGITYEVRVPDHYQATHPEVGDNVEVCGIVRGESNGAHIMWNKGSYRLINRS